MTSSDQSATQLARPRRTSPHVPRRSLSSLSPHVGPHLGGQNLHGSPETSTRSPTSPRSLGDVARCPGDATGDATGATGATGSRTHRIHQDPPGLVNAGCCEDEQQTPAASKDSDFNTSKIIEDVHLQMATIVAPWGT